MRIVSSGAQAQGVARRTVTEQGQAPGAAVTAEGLAGNSLPRRAGVWAGGGELEYVPTKITLTAEQGFDREIALALRAEMERTGEDPRAIAVALLRAAVRAGLRPVDRAGLVAWAAYESAQG